jgi:hypothetical protein
LLEENVRDREMQFYLLGIVPGDRNSIYGKTHSRNRKDRITYKRGNEPCIKRLWKTIQEKGQRIEAQNMKSSIDKMDKGPDQGKTWNLNISIRQLGPEQYRNLDKGG